MANIGPPDRPRSIIAPRVAWLGLFLLGVALVTGALYLGTQGGFSAKAIEDTIQSWGAWGVLASIGLMILHSFVPFPAEFLAIANGMIYGPLWGTVITWSGAMLGGFLAFGLARALGRPFVEVMVARKDWAVLDEWAAIRSGRLVFISRFIPVIAFNLVNYAAGLTRISWWTFAWATGIGILPMTTLMVVMGDRIETLAWQVWLLVGAGAVVLWFAFRHHFRPRQMSGSRDRRASSGGSHHRN